MHDEPDVVRSGRIDHAPDGHHAADLDHQRHVTTGPSITATTGVHATTTTPRVSTAIRPPPAPGAASAVTTTTTTVPNVTGPPAGSTWHVLFADDFAGSSLSSSGWSTCYPWFTDPAAGCTNFGNAELEWYLPSQDQVSGGALHLVAQESATSGQDANGQPHTYPWTSGMVTTNSHADFTYGYIQAVARIPKGDGYWPGLWLLPTSQAWPPEIDIMEAYGNDTAQADFTNHPVGSAQQQLQYDAGEDLSAGYHSYAVDWEPGSITWYLDGQARYTVTSGIPGEPMYFLADLAVDNALGLGPDGSTPSSASFDIKSVEIWQH